MIECSQKSHRGIETLPGTTAEEIITMSCVKSKCSQIQSIFRGFTNHMQVQVHLLFLSFF